MPLRSLREEELRLRLGWFVRIRWIFVVGFAAAALGAYFAVGLRFPLARVLCAAASILCYNIAFFVYHSLKRPLIRPRLEANLQMYLDLVHLTVLVHLLGGIESPMLYFYVFHAILGSMLLSRTEDMILGLVSISMTGVVVGLEYTGVLQHYHFAHVFSESAHRDPLTVLILGSAFSVMLFGTIYMSSSIVASLHTREKELVAARQALGKKSEDLEAANRALRDHQETLLRTEKLASLGELSAGIAHEINNPVQFIQGNMQIVREAMQDITPILDELHQRNADLTIARLDYPFFREHISVLIQDMADGAVRIADIVKDLKTFARSDEGRQSDDVDLNEILRASLRLLHNRLKRHQIASDLDPALPTIRGSSNRLEQVIVNTLTNAAEALSGRDDGIIRVSSGRDPDGLHVRLSVTDNGPGMSDEVKLRVFDPFFTTKSRAGGSGLGLAISYAIVQEHGGRIDVDSEVGKGSTFNIVLPVARAAS